MANVDETGASGYDWEVEGIYQLEIADRVQGGAGGVANRQATELARRTKNLHLRLSSAEQNKANLESPALTGTPTAPTAATATNNTQVATTAFVKAVVAALVASAPGTLDTLNELAAALGDDPNFATTIANELALKAPKVSPAFSGTPTAPTQGQADNSTKLATTAFVKAAIAALLDAAPGTLDTLNELAAALGDDPNFATTIANELALKAPKASPALTGTPTAPTAAPGVNTQQIATTAFVQAALAALVAAAPGTLDTLNELAAALGDDPNFATTIANELALKAPKASPAFSGTPTAPTAAPGANTQQIATTAFVQAALTTLGLEGIFNNPVFTGVPITPTAAQGTNTQQVASTAFVQAAIAALVAAAPGTLDTLNELAAALGDDPNFATTVTNALAGKLVKTSNLSDLSNVATARTNLGLGALAVLSNISFGQVNSSLTNYVTLSDGNVDLGAYGGGKITLTANTSFSFSGFQLNKSYMLIATANGYLPAFADGTKHLPVEGNADLGTAGVFYINLTCVDATPGAEKLLTTIMKGA